MKVKFGINDKLFYRFIEFTSKLNHIDLTHESFKLICLNQDTPQTKQEIRVKRFANAFRYVVDNSHSDLTLEFLDTVHFLLLGRKMSNKIKKDLLEKYYLIYDDHPQLKASKIHLFMIGQKLKMKSELAFLITNYILIKDEIFPIIVYPNDAKVYKDAIKIRLENPNQFYLFLLQNEHFIRKTHQHKMMSINEQKTKDEVISILKSETNTLKTKYHVKKLYLYGSFAKETDTAISDIDILVVLNDYMINYEKYEIMKKIKKYLSEIMAYRLDVMEFSHALSSLEIHEMTHIITII